MFFNYTKFSYVIICPKMSRYANPTILLDAMLQALILCLYIFKYFALWLFNMQRMFYKYFPIKLTDISNNTCHEHYNSFSSNITWQFIIHSNQNLNNINFSILFLSLKLPNTLFSI